MLNEDDEDDDSGLVLKRSKTTRCASQLKWIYEGSKFTAKTGVMERLVILGHPFSMLA